MTKDSTRGIPAATYLYSSSVRYASRQMNDYVNSEPNRMSIVPVTESDIQRLTTEQTRDTIRISDRDIEAMPLDIQHSHSSITYKGRLRIWPGIVFLVFLFGFACSAITYFGLQVKRDSDARAKLYAEALYNRTVIKGGESNVGGDIISDDGVIGNPKSYPASGCELPDYQSKNGHIVAVSSNGTEVKLKIKGINWFGMETGQAIPFGLWDNSFNGTTAYQIATFLSNNKFNAVRLPLMVSWILENKVPNQDLINKQENRAIDASTYMSLLQGLIKALQYRHIAVMLSMHTLTYEDNGNLWYNNEISETKFLSAIDVLTKNLCSFEYWNVIGIDLKNEPYMGTWGDNTSHDFRAGAIRIANRMLDGCSNWLGFVEGVNAPRSVNIDGEVFNYYDWYGGGLQGAKTKPLEFQILNKVVWAPHYYTPAVFPQMYLYGGGAIGPVNTIQNYIELDDKTLYHRVQATMDDMFGFLANEDGPAILLGEFGGLYAKDKHPKKTTQRCTDYSIDIIKKPGWAGGFVWSLNPESAYQYNPADSYGHFTEGVLEDDWLSADKDFLGALKAMDDMENLQKFPCFKIKLDEASDK